MTFLKCLMKLAKCLIADPGFGRFLVFGAHEKTFRFHCLSWNVHWNWKSLSSQTQNLVFFFVFGARERTFRFQCLSWNVYWNWKSVLSQTHVLVVFLFLELMRKHLDSIVCLEIPTETGKVSYRRLRFWSFFSFLELMREHLDSNDFFEMSCETDKVTYCRPRFWLFFRFWSSWENI